MPEREQPAELNQERIGSLGEIAHIRHVSKNEKQKHHVGGGVSEDVRILDKQILDKVENELGSMDPNSPEYKTRQQELIRKYSSEVWEKFVKDQPQEAEKLKNTHKGIRDALSQASLSVQGIVPQQPKTKNFSIKKPRFFTADEESEYYGLSPQEAQREKQQAQEEKTARIRGDKEREAENIFLGKKEKQVTKTQAERIMLGKTQEEKKMEEMFGGKKMTEKEAREAILGKVDIEEGEKQAIDTFLGVEKVYKTEAEVIEQEKKKAYLIDASRVAESMAELMADEELEYLSKHSKWWERFQIRHNESGKRREIYNRILSELKSKKNLSDLVARRIAGVKIEGDSEQINYQILDAVIEKFDKEIEEGIERGDVVNDDNVNLALGEVFRKFADPKEEIKTRAEFDALVNKDVIPKIRALHKKFGSESKEADALLYAHNFYQMAEAYNTRIQEIIAENPDNMEAVRTHISALMKLDIQLGMHERDIMNNHPQKKDLSWSEWLVDRAQTNYKGKLGGVVNPVTMGAIGALAGQALTSRAVKIGATAGIGIATGTAAFMLPTIGGLIGGGLAARGFARSRKGLEVERDRSLAAKRAVLGQEAASEREELMRRFRHQRENDTAENFRNHLESLLAKPELSDEDKENVAAIVAKLNLEKELNIDLVGVSEKTGAYGVRLLEMNPMLLKLKEVRDKFNLHDEDFGKLVGERHDAVFGELKKLGEDYEEFKSKEKGSAGRQAFVKGVVTAAVLQFGIDQLRGHGIPLFDTHKHGSLIGAAASGLTHPNENYLESIQGPFLENHLGGVAGRINLPDGYHVTDRGFENGRHLFAIVDVRGHVLSGADKLVIDPSGRIDNDSLVRLARHGFNLDGLVRHEGHDINLPGPKTEAPDIDNALKNLIPGLVEHPHTDWHDNLHIAGYEGKQQMLYLSRDANGNVIADLHAMFANIAKNVHEFAGADHKFVNPDGTRDNVMEAEYKKWAGYVADGLHKHMKLEITPSHGSKLSLDLSVDENGHAKIPEAIAKHLTSLRSGELNVAKIEVMSQDGDVLATATGHDLPVPLHAGIEAPASEAPRVEVFDTNIRPPIEPDQVLPLAWVKRKPLGTKEDRRQKETPPTTKPEQPQELISGEMGLENMQELVSEKYKQFQEQDPKNSGGRMAEFMQSLGFGASDWEFVDGKPEVYKLPEQQLKLPEDMRITTDKEILEDVRYAVEMLGSKNPHRTKKQFEKALSATWALFHVKTGWAIDMFARFAYENFGLKQGKEWIISKRGKITLKQTQHVAKLLKDFAHRKKLEQAWSRMLKRAAKAVEKGEHVPKMRINLLEPKAKSPLDAFNSENEDNPKG